MDGLLLNVDLKAVDRDRRCVEVAIGEAGVSNFHSHYHDSRNDAQLLGSSLCVVPVEPGVSDAYHHLTCICTRLSLASPNTSLTLHQQQDIRPLVLDLHVLLLEGRIGLPARTDLLHLLSSSSFGLLLGRILAP